MQSKQNDEIKKGFEDTKKAYQDEFVECAHGSEPVRESKINLATTLGKFTAIDKILKAAEIENKIPSYYQRNMMDSEESEISISFNDPDFLEKLGNVATCINSDNKDKCDLKQI